MEDAITCRAGQLGGSSCSKAVHRRMVIVHIWLVTGRAS
jgi:hypothetical protein